MTNEELKNMLFIIDTLLDDAITDSTRQKVKDNLTEVCQLAMKALDQRWIPVSERLPEDDGYYFVTEKDGRIGTYVFHKQGNSEEYWKRCAIAWMPLPEPYREDAE